MLEIINKFEAYFLDEITKREKLAKKIQHLATISLFQMLLALD